jgi:hypothetical protein
LTGIGTKEVAEIHQPIKQENEYVYFREKILKV